GFNSSEITQFKQVILSDFIKTIKSKLPYSDFIELNRDNIYFQYYLQFINTIENRKKNKEIREIIIKHKLSPELLNEETELNKKWKAELKKVDNEISQKLARLKRKLKQNKVHSSLKDSTYADQSIIPFNRYLKISISGF